MLFAVVMVFNAVIGIAQELRSKRTLDRLSVVAAPRLTVVRDGAPTVVDRTAVVLDDVVVLAPGDQLVVDGTIVEAGQLSIDESLLTGEADAVAKSPGDAALSGSFVVAGSGTMRTTAVGDDAYAARLTREAKAFRRPRSELERGIDSILRVVTWIIVPAAVGLFLAQRYGEGDTLDDALIGTVTGLVALVPQGLVLLLSMAQAVAVIRLGRAQVLVQQLQAVETLARVTLLATDKTGHADDRLRGARPGRGARRRPPGRRRAGRPRRGRPAPRPDDGGDRCRPTRSPAVGRHATASRSPRRTSTAPSTSPRAGRGTSGRRRCCCAEGDALARRPVPRRRGDAGARARQGGGGLQPAGVRPGRPRVRRARHLRRRDPSRRGRRPSPTSAPSR